MGLVWFAAVLSGLVLLREAGSRFMFGGIMDPDYNPWKERLPWQVHAVLAWSTGVICAYIIWGPG